MTFPLFGTKKKGELAVLTAGERATLSDPYNQSNEVGIRYDILWFLKGKTAGARPEEIADQTKHSYQAVLTALKELEQENKIMWTPF